MAPMDWPHRATHSHGSTATEAFTRRATVHLETPRAMAPIDQPHRTAHSDES